MKVYLKFLNKLFGFNSIPPIAYLFGVPFFVLYFPLYYAFVFLRWSFGYKQCIFCKRYCSPREHFVKKEVYLGNSKYGHKLKCNACEVGDKLITDYR